MLSDQFEERKKVTSDLEMNLPRHRECQCTCPKKKGALEVKVWQKRSHSFLLMFSSGGLSEVKVVF